MKPTIQPQSHLVSAHAQPSRVSRVPLSAFRQTRSHRRPTQIGLTRTIPPAQSTSAALQAWSRGRPYDLRAIKSP
jgi:hypothetical protein